MVTTALMFTHTPPPLRCQYNHGVSLQRLLGSGAVSPGGGCGQPGDQGKKMMHHCHVCNRGFLNKSNIKVNRQTNIFKHAKSALYLINIRYLGSPEDAHGREAIWL